IISERGDRNTRAGGQVLDLRNRGGVKGVHVDMGDTGVSALGLSGGPAHQFDTGKTVLGSELEDLFQGLVGEDRRDETKLHGWETPMNVPFVASLTSTI